ncbi:MAG TPA: hypothetical protein VN408_14260, partial [Actinoplanes sp.]|nr:hypothetical protein [Actinoplanes sp.]
MSLAPQSERHAAPPPAIPQTPVIGLTVTTVAAVFILVSVAVRAVVAYRGFLTYDDFPLLSMAEKNTLHADYLFGLFNNHLMPAGHLLTWLTLRFGGFAYEPFLALMILGQLVVGIALYRLLRLMLLPGWGILVPLGVFLLSPLTLEATSWWAVGINMLPMQLAMVLALGAQVRFIRTRHRKHLVTLAASVLFG